MKKLNTQKIYTLSEIVETGVMQPYRKSLPGVRQMVLNDRNQQNVLDAMITGKANNRRYFIKGRNIQQLKKKLENGYDI